MRRGDGTYIWVEITNHNLLDDARHLCVETDVADISEEMATNEKLRSPEPLLRRITEALPTGIVQIDTRRKLVFANTRSAEMLGPNTLAISTVCWPG